MKVGQPVEILERGDIYFLYRPKVGRFSPKALADIQRFYISVKNPRAPSPSSVDLPGSLKAKFPEELAKLFRHRRFISLEVPDFLNYQGAEILLVGTRTNIFDELGIRLDARREWFVNAEVFEDLKLERSVHRIQPLFGGRWA